MTNNVSKLPSITDREYPRVNSVLYLQSEHYSPTHASQDNKDVFMPTFIEKEADLVGLSIDAFWEKVNKDSPQDKDYFLQLQQLLSQLKSFYDTDPLRRSQNMFKKLKVNISGSGIAFPSDVAYHNGHLLRLSLFFPRYPFSYVNIVSEVIRSEKADIGYEIKCQYKDVSKEAHAEILKFVKECQKNK